MSTANSKGVMRQGVGLRGVARLGSAGAGGFGPADPASIVQSLRSTSDGLTIYDAIETLTKPDIVQRGALLFDVVGDYITADIGATAVNHFGACTITSYFNASSVAGPSVIHALGSAGYRVYINTTIIINGIADTSITPAMDTLYKLVVTFNSAGEGTSAVLTKLSDGTTQSWSGTAVVSSLGTETVWTVGARNNSGSVGLYFDGTIAGVYVSSSNGPKWSMEETSGTTVYDVGGNGYHGTVVPAGSGIATMRSARVDGVASHNALYGFRESSGVKIPALLDGSAAADGNPITNEGGAVHNDSGTKIEQQDAYFTGGTANFYSADGLTADQKTYAELVAHHDSTNGDDNLWVKIVSPNVVLADQYDFTKVFTANETANNLLFYGGA